ncbi:sensor histidine kinase [Cohnella cholangitidis]|uniref:HAMP domain-containing protein n=1 Tax=Cohnella cholangitidis TaxID=2598458 RepID=A0A7G5BX28_9BACL|nr:histidine kinase [Cohnella cholangitidis]QMV41512.1 HAMP domain-containing protein [Cohnella cholangitidis]
MLRSIKTQLTISFFVVMLPIVLFLYGNNLYAKQVVRDKVSETYRNTLDIFVHQTDESMNIISEYLNKLTVLDDNVGLLMSYPYGSDNYILTKVRIQNALNRDVDFYNLIDTIVIYSKNDMMLSTDSIGQYTNIKNMFTENIDRMIGEGKAAGQGKWIAWNDSRVAGGDFLINFVKVPTEELYVGAMIKVTDLLELLSIQWDDGDIGEGAIYGPDGRRLGPQKDEAQASLSHEDIQTDDAPYKFVNDKISGKRYMILNRSSETANMTTSILVPEGYMLQGLPYFQKATYFIMFGILLLFTLYMFFIRHTLFNPLQLLISGMKKISLGILDIRLQTTKTVELEFLANTFNNMAEQIKSLRIGMYEEQLRAQRIELKQLQAQINPHFYMNSLNIIYNFAALDDTGSVKQMALHLGDYFRFIMKGNRDLISLEEELKHIRNYIEIQKFRYPDLLHCNDRIEDWMKGVMIPALSLQPFVENSIIHGFVNHKRPFSISITGSLSLDHHGKFLNITIEDDGAGFPDDVLSSLRNGDSLPQAESSRLGILNVVQRLKLRYDRSSVEFANASPEGGAIVRLKLPLDSKLEPN